MKVYKVSPNEPQLIKLDGLIFPHDRPLDFSDHFCWLAEADDGKPAGFATLQLWPKFAYLSRAGVLKDYRRQGIHTRLIDVRVRAAIASWGRSRVVTYTAAHNIASANALLSRGFKLYEPPSHWGELGDGYLYLEREL